MRTAVDWPHVSGTALKTVLLLCCPFLLLVYACGTGPAAEEPPTRAPNGAEDGRSAERTSWGGAGRATRA